MLKLSKLRDKGIDITKLSDTEEVVSVLKDINRIDEVDKPRCPNDKVLRERVVKISPIVWEIALKRDDIVLIQMFQNSIKELGLKNVYLNDDVMEESELRFFLKPGEDTITLMEIINMKNMEELEAYKAGINVGDHKAGFASAGLCIFVACQTFNDYSLYIARLVAGKAY